MGAYFTEKGLVRQQLDSFNQFIRHTIQSIVSCRAVELELQEQYRPGTLPTQQKVSNISDRLLTVSEFLQDQLLTDHHDTSSTH